MTVEDYEREGGFRAELAHVREIGMRLTSLRSMIYARPHRMPEFDALKRLESALDELRGEIADTRGDTR